MRRRASDNCGDVRYMVMVAMAMVVVYGVADGPVIPYAVERNYPKTIRIRGDGNFQLCRLYRFRG